MKLGLGLYRRMLTPENFRFARQAGATHVVAHLVDYMADARLPDSREENFTWGVTRNEGKLWSEEELRDLVAAARAEGLEIAAIENFDPSHWYDILLDGPRRDEQIEGIKTIIRRVGAAGIPCIGYSFSLANTWGQVMGPHARGGAESWGFHGTAGLRETEIPWGQVWNMIYEPDAPPGTIGAVREEEMWDRLDRFLHEVVPVAEEAGVRLAAHPADPPLPVLRNTGRLFYRPDHFQRLLDLVPSHSNAIEFCQGTVAEMAGSDVYDAIDTFSRQDAIAYVHFRNVRGTVPEYREVFLDEGDVDMLRALDIYRRNGFDGVIIPDHTPQMTCPGPWHAGMAHALGWMRAALTAIEREPLKGSLP